MLSQPRRLAVFPEGPPLLQVVIDTELEFDWTKPFARDSVSVSSMDMQYLAQDILMGYGIKPTYVIDYPIATQPSSIAVLRSFLAKDSCLIGSHLHSWVNPPFDEQITLFNSYAGNLDPTLERRKLECLSTAIEEAFGLRPTIYKAGRYGIGPSTPDTLQALGYEIDMSVVPYTDFGRDGGPDFRAYPDRPYWFGDREQLLEIPMTRGFSGLTAPFGPRLFSAVDTGFGHAIHLGAILSRTGLLERATLTPEGIGTASHRRLVRAMLERGHRVFTMTFHSPSLAPGHTPYVRTASDLQQFLDKIRYVLDFFFGKLGGQPTTPPEVRQLALGTRDEFGAECGTECDTGRGGVPEGREQPMSTGPAIAAASAWRIVTVAGNGTRGHAGDGGPANAASLDNPFDIAFDPAGRLVFSDTFNHCLRRVDLRTGLISTIAGTGQAGYAGDGGPAIAARFNEPYGVAIDRAGNIYTADRLNRVVRRIDGASGIVTTLAGTGAADTSGAEGPAARTGLAEPNGLALSPDQRLLYIADVADHRIRVVDLASGAMTTFAGTGEGAHAGDGGPARQAAIFGARAVAVAAGGSVFVLERQGSTLRRVDPATGIITTIAGTGARGYGGDGGPAGQAVFDRPKELALTPDGDLLVVDTENHAIRLVDRAADRVSTVSGNGTAGYGGEDFPALSACLARPHGAAVGPDGTIYIANSENHRLRRLIPLG